MARVGAETYSKLIADPHCISRLARWTRLRRTFALFDELVKLCSAALQADYDEL